MERNIAASEHVVVVKTTFFPEGTRMFNTHGQSICAHLQDTGLTHPGVGPISGRGMPSVTTAGAPWRISQRVSQTVRRMRTDELPEEKCGCKGMYSFLRLQRSPGYRSWACTPSMPLQPGGGKSRAASKTHWDRRRQGESLPHATPHLDFTCTSAHARRIF